MPKITVLPHPDYAPQGATFETDTNTAVCDVLLDHGIEIEDACGKVETCTTCHVVIAQGFDSLNPASEQEEDMLDRAWGLQPTFRLSWQSIVGDADLVVNIPR